MLQELSGGSGQLTPNVALVEEPAEGAVRDWSLRASRSKLMTGPRIMVALALVLLLCIPIAGSLILRQPRPQAEAARTHIPKRIAVLPFDNLGDSTAAYFAEGITDEVRGELASLPSVRVIARGSSMPITRALICAASAARSAWSTLLMAPCAGSKSRVGPACG